MDVKSTFTIDGIPIPDVAIHPVFLHALLNRRAQNTAAFNKPHPQPQPQQQPIQSTPQFHPPPQSQPKAATQSQIHSEPKPPTQFQPKLQIHSQLKPMAQSQPKPSTQSLPVPSQPSRLEAPSLQSKSQSVPLESSAISHSSNEFAATNVKAPETPVVTTTPFVTTMNNTDLKSAKKEASKEDGEKTEGRMANFCFVCGESTHYARACQTYKTEVCSFWAIGRCKFGPACRNAHGESELRTYIFDIECENCGAKHITKLCREPKVEERELFCDACEGTDHDRKDCPDKKCKTCKSTKHWTNECEKCQFCTDWHQSSKCPYMYKRKKY